MTKREWSTAKSIIIGGGILIITVSVATVIGAALARAQPGVQCTHCGPTVERELEKLEKALSECIAVSYTECRMRIPSGQDLRTVIHALQELREEIKALRHQVMPPSPPVPSLNAMPSFCRACGEHQPER